MLKVMASCHLLQKVGSKYGKKLINKGISASKSLKTAAIKFNQSKYDKALKKEG